MARRPRKDFNSNGKPSAFDECIALHMRDGEKTLQAVKNVINALGLPLPTGDEDFLRGTEGALLFSSRYGVVIRIECEKDRFSSKKIPRVNDNPWVLQPLATFRAEKALIEICPGVGTTCDEDDLLWVQSALRATGIQLADAHLGNIGILPIPTPLVPKGVPVVIDRTGVDRLSRTTKNIKAALKEMDLSTDPQKDLYEPLRTALHNAWPSAAANPLPQKIKKFWQSCEAFTRKGVLIAGWDQLENDTDGWKQSAAADSAKHYDRKIATFRKNKLMK